MEGNITPTEDLSAFDGAGAMGEWRIEVTDTAAGDGGTLNRWCVYITEE
jgi:subtilisin-like proprotein convertase family protein